MINKIIAHRGAWKEFNLKQNSLEALRKAIELNCFGSECDVHLSADNHIVVNHDHEFLGLNIETSTFKELQDISLVNNFKISGLHDFLNTIISTDLKLFVEIKSSELGGLERTKLLIDVLKNKYISECYLDKVDFILFDFEAALYLKSKMPKFKVHYLNGDKLATEIHENNLDGIDYHYNVIFNLTHDSFLEFTNKGLITNSWTVNDLEVAIKLKDKCIDYITTDYPMLFINNGL